MDYCDPKCLVCQNDSDGIHFTVQTCRACAMFFRRCLKQNSNFHCKNHPKYCNLSSAENRLMCKKCRLEKCFKVGMKSAKKSPEPIYNHEIAKNRYGSKIIYDVIDPDTGKFSRLIHVGPIIKRSRLILENHQLPDDVINMNALEKMVFGLKKVRNSQKMDPKIISTLPFRDYFYFWELNMQKCAEWLMYSMEFRKLPFHEKLEIFKLVWAVWRRVERKTMSAEIFGWKCFDEKILLLSDDFAGRVDHFSMDITEIWSSSATKISNMFGQEISQYYEDLVKPFLALKLSDDELNFVLCQIIFQYAGRRLQGQTLQAADQFLAEISENLNDFYEKPMGTGTTRNYASRLTKMMQIVNRILALQLKQEKLMDMVFLFDMFNFKFSDPSFFCV